MPRLAKGLLALAICALTPASGQANVIVGSALNHATTTSNQIGSPAEYVQTTLAGALLSSPVNGTVVAWNVRGTTLNGPANLLTLRVLRPSGSAFTFVNRSAPHDFPNGASDDALRTLSTSLPIRVGDVVSLHGSTNARVPLANTGGALYETFSGVEADGNPTGAPTGTGLAGELQFNAEIEPTNTFSVSPAQIFKKNGTASLTATLPNPGSLQVQGSLVKAQTLMAQAEGALPVTLNPTKAARKRLMKKGKASGQADFTFTPNFGTPASQTVLVVLKMKPKRKHR